MTEAALFYETAHANLGQDFLDDIRHAIDAIRERPKLGVDIAYGFRRVLVRRPDSDRFMERASGLQARE